MRIVLLGFMCSGKTRTGEVLSKKLGWPHYDTDRIIEERTGLTIAQLINKHGEGNFRDIERQAVEDVSKNDNCIISTGGGVPMDERNMDNLSRESQIFWLKAAPEMVLKRVGDIKKRPLINTSKPIETIRDLMEQRRDFYAVAQHTIRTDKMSVEAVAEKIMSTIPNIKN